MALIRHYISRINSLLSPKAHVAGLGRWGSSLPEGQKYSIWFHDMCSQDNCFTNASFLKRVYKLPPPPPRTPPPSPPPILPFEIDSFMYEYPIVKADSYDREMFS